MANKKTNIQTEREYTIPLREKSRVVPRYKKTPKAIKTIKEFVAKHMRIENRDLKKVKIDKDLNEFLWARGIRKHPHKIKVKVSKKGENVIVELINYPNKLKFKKLREEKRGKEALEAVENKKTMMQKVKESLKKPEEKDKDKDGLDDKKEAEEKEKASAEASQEFQKAQAKKAKHQTEKPAKAAKPFRQALQK